MLPVWGYDVAGDFAAVGRHFLAFAAGTLAGGVFVRRFRPRVATHTLLVAGCAMAAAGLALLALLPPQLPWRFTGIALIGIAAGLLHAGLFEAIFPEYGKSPAVTLNSGGIYFGSGSIVCTLLVSGTFWAYSASTILLILAAVPIAFLFFYSRRRFQPIGIISHPEVLKQFRSAAAILFSLLLFFQFGNEWSVAVWLPLFLIHRLGMSPVGSLALLVFYFVSLTVGRIAVYYLLPRINQWRLLAASAAASLFACVVLAATNSRFGAGVCVFLLGLGFAAIYPLVAAWIGRRFPYYHPGFFNGIFSIALAGGMLSPWLLGEIAGKSGIWAVMTLPAIGTCMVMVLLCLMWVESKVIE